MQQRNYQRGLHLVEQDNVMNAPVQAIRVQETQEKHNIYVLIDPRDESVRYVGISKNPRKRLREHIRCDNIDNPGKDAWMIDLTQNGLAPILCIIEVADSRALALKREMYWVDFCKSQGMPLLNHPKYLKREGEVEA